MNIASRNRVLASYTKKMEKALGAVSARHNVSFTIIKNYYKHRHLKAYVGMGYKIYGIEGSFMIRKDVVLGDSSDRTIIARANNIVNDHIKYKRDYLNNG